MSKTTEQSPPLHRSGETIAAFVRGFLQKPLQALLALGIFATLVYFFGFYPAFVNGLFSALQWVPASWGTEHNQEHSWLVPPIFLFLLWYHRGAFFAARKAPSNWGLLSLSLGILLFLASVRTLQPRLAIVAIPVVLFGIAHFLGGRQVARLAVFPCLFLLFMVPIGGFVQGTVTLQLLVSSSVQLLAGLIGVKIEMIGTTLKAMDGSFNFEIAEGCSGIRSLMAMTMLSALFVHFTQKETWKQIVIFCGSLVFALIGNVGRIFTVILFAKFISPRIAGGIYHDYSGFIFFPFAVATMVSFSRLVNTDWHKVFSRFGSPSVAPLPPPSSLPVARGEDAAKPGSPVSYDY